MVFYEKDLETMVVQYRQQHPEFTQEQLLLPLQIMHRHIASLCGEGFGPAHRMDVYDALIRLDEGVVPENASFERRCTKIRSYVLEESEVVLEDLRSFSQWKAPPPEQVPAYCHAVSELTKILRDAIVQEKLARSRKQLWEYQRLLRDHRALTNYVEKHLHRHTRVANVFPTHILHQIAWRAKLRIAAFLHSLEPHGEAVCITLIDECHALDVNDKETDRTQQLYDHFPLFKEARAYICGDLPYLPKETEIAKKLELDGNPNHARFPYFVCAISRVVRDMVCQVKYAEIKGYLTKPLTPNKRPSEPLANAAPQPINPELTPRKKRVKINP